MPTAITMCLFVFVLWSSDLSSTRPEVCRWLLLLMLMAGGLSVGPFTFRAPLLGLGRWGDLLEQSLPLLEKLEQASGEARPRLTGTCAESGRALSNTSWPGAGVKGPSSVLIGVLAAPRLTT